MTSLIRELSRATGSQSRQGLSHETVTLVYCIRPHEKGTWREL